MGDRRHSVVVRPDGEPRWQAFGVDTDAELAWCIEPREALEDDLALLCLVGAHDESTRVGNSGDLYTPPIAVTVLERAAGEWRAVPNEEFGRSATE
jgi:hypothetical protein